MRPVPVTFLRLAFSDQLSRRESNMSAQPSQSYHPKGLQYSPLRYELGIDAGENVHLRILAEG